MPAVAVAAPAQPEESLSPDALIPGYQKCYVVGCWQNAVLSARHKSFGPAPVESCLGHNPANHGMAKPLVRVPVAPQEPERSVADESLDEVRELTPEERIAVLLRELLHLAAAPPQPPADPEGGVKARLQPQRPILPSGAVGLPTPV